MDNRPIGVFDSGLGGLSCLAQLEHELPNESYIYFGDTARTPYGDKAPETIKYFTCQVADFLVSQGVKMLIIACNTISALCTDMLRKRFPDITVVDIITPTVSYMTKQDNKNAIGIIATKATINSGMYEKLLKEGGVDKPIYSKACPLLVPLIEGGFREGVVPETVVKHYLDEMVTEKEIGSLILGCTHYPFVQSSIEKNYPSLELINPAKILSSEVRKILAEKDISATTENKASCLFYASELSETFLEMIKHINPNGDYEVNLKNFTENYKDI